MPALDVIEEPEQALSGAINSLKFTPISQAWQFSSAMRIKADLEYLTPYGVRVQFPASAAEHLLFFPTLRTPRSSWPSFSTLVMQAKFLETGCIAWYRTLLCSGQLFVWLS